MAEGLLHPRATIVHHTEKGQTEYPIDETMEHCFLKGHLTGMPDATAHVSICRGLSGLITVDDDLLLIEPVFGEDPQHPKLEIK